MSKLEDNRATRLHLHTAGTVGGLMAFVSPAFDPAAQAAKLNAGRACKWQREVLRLYRARYPVPDALIAQSSWTDADLAPLGLTVKLLDRKAAALAKAERLRKAGQRERTARRRAAREASDAVG